MLMLLLQGGGVVSLLLWQLWRPLPVQLRRRPRRPAVHGALLLPAASLPDPAGQLGDGGTAPTPGGTCMCMGQWMSEMHIHRWVGGGMGPHTGDPHARGWGVATDAQAYTCACPPKPAHNRTPQLSALLLTQSRHV